MYNRRRSNKRRAYKCTLLKTIVKDKKKKNNAKARKEQNTEQMRHPSHQQQKKVQKKKNKAKQLNTKAILPFPSISTSASCSFTFPPSLFCKDTHATSVFFLLPRLHPTTSVVPASWSTMTCARSSARSRSSYRATIARSPEKVRRM